MIKEIVDFFLPFTRCERSLLILGAGLTGNALAQLLYLYRVPFSLYDRDLSCLTEKIHDWKPYLAEAWDEQTSENFWTTLPKFTDVILSPGIPRREAMVVEAEKNAQIWNDIDFFYPLLETKKLIAVTGTDGKSSTVELIRHLLGDSALSCGNNDIPLSQVLERILSPPEKNMIEVDTVVIEFSSFMLEKIYRFRADYNIILNIAPDHLDRYHEFSDYVAVKHHLLSQVRPGDTYLYNLDKPETAPRTSVSKVITYSCHGRDADFMMKDGRCFSKENSPLLGEQGKEVKEDFIKLPTLFSDNILPALIIAHEEGVPTELIRSRLQNFVGLPHRLELVPGAKNFINEDIFVYNNSKATTLQAVMGSIDHLYDHHQKVIHIILGGRSKNIDFHLLQVYQEKVKAYFYGEAGKQIREQSGLSGIYIEKLGECITRVLTEIPAGGVLVLAPGCSSFDQFHNYRERGVFFKEKVLSSNDPST